MPSFDESTDLGSLLKAVAALPKELYHEILKYSYSSDSLFWRIVCVYSWDNDLFRDPMNEPLKPLDPGTLSVRAEFKAARLPTPRLEAASTPPRFWRIAIDACGIRSAEPLDNYPVADGTPFPTGIRYIVEDDDTIRALKPKTNVRFHEPFSSI